MAKDTYIRVRCTTAEKILIKTAAQRRDITMSDFMLTATTEKITKADINAVYGTRSLKSSKQ